MRIFARNFTSKGLPAAMDSLDAQLAHLFNFAPKSQRPKGPTFLPQKRATTRGSAIPTPIYIGSGCFPNDDPEA
jgi:hypothetical protein